MFICWTEVTGSFLITTRYTSVYILYFIFYNFIFYILYFIFYILYFIFYILYFYILYFIFYILYFIFYILYFKQFANFLHLFSIFRPLAIHKTMFPRTPSNINNSVSSTNEAERSSSEDPKAFLPRLPSPPLLSLPPPIPSWSSSSVWIVENQTLPPPSQQHNPRLYLQAYPPLFPPSPTSPLPLPSPLFFLFSIVLLVFLPMQTPSSHSLDYLVNIEPSTKK